MPTLRDKNPFQTSLILCILVLVLLLYINRQEYINECDERLYIKDVSSQYQTLHQTGENVSFNNGTMLEKHKKDILNPEKRIMDEHIAGKELDDKIQKMDDPLHLEDLSVKQNETKDQQLNRSLITADYDGPQLEGMSAPVDEFERAYMNRQDQKHQEIYGEQAHMPSNADSLSMLNM